MMGAAMGAAMGTAMAHDRGSVFEGVPVFEI